MIYIHKETEKDVEIRFDTSNHELDKPLCKGKNKTVIGLMKDVSEGKIMVKFIGLTTKTYSYLINKGGEDEKAKCTKRWS